jgi:hypothetical protein
VNAELVRAAQPDPPPPVAAAPVGPPSLPVERVLHELVTPVEPPAEAPAAPAPIDAPRADQALLDSLIRKDDEGSP